MPPSPQADDPSNGDPARIGDDFLLRSAAAGDGAALAELMRRYDRLVRYTVFRFSRTQCTRDPQWLDDVASTAWHGLIHNARTNASLPRSLSSLLVTIARNQCISALRRRRPEFADAASGALPAEEVEDGAVDPSTILHRLELLAALRECINDLDPEAARLAVHLSDILENRWQTVGRALGVSESTLRSRWPKVIGALRACLRRKHPEFFAPDGIGSDLP